jgi:glycosyltransferase involved in cell wall biosynthesis
MIRRFKSQGYKVIVLTQFDGYQDLVGEEVDEIKSLFISRRGVNPLVDLLTITHLVFYLLKYNPILLLTFTIKPVIYGSIAARIANVRSIAMITGLGTTFIAETWISKVVRILYRHALKSVSCVFFQNLDDKEIFISNRLVDPMVCRLVPGSGINVSKYRFSIVPNESEFVFLLIARMLWDKGIGEFVDAARVLRGKYPDVRFQLLGPLGVENRTAIEASKIAEWEKEGFIEYLGETRDVASYIEKATCIVLPSYREGTSHVLLEAAAIGRPIVTSNVTGCKEIVDDGVNGYLCEPRDHLSLAKKMELMLKTSIDARKIMGILGRKKIKKQFSEHIVLDLYIKIMSKIINREPL